MRRQCNERDAVHESDCSQHDVLVAFFRDDPAHPQRRLAVDKRQQVLLGVRLNVLLQQLIL